MLHIIFELEKFTSIGGSWQPLYIGNKSNKSWDFIWLLYSNKLRKYAKNTNQIYNYINVISTYLNWGHFPQIELSKYYKPFYDF